jgi:CheY-like chemotaxis protein
MKTVLVIEDNLDIRENTAEMLELEGFDVITAEDGQEGLELAIKHCPNVILCDIMMPKLNGYEVLKQLKENEKTVNIPFIYASASVEKKEVKHAMQLGADAYIRKPFDLNELVELVNKFIGK